MYFNVNIKCISAFVLQNNINWTQIFRFQFQVCWESLPFFFLRKFRKRAKLHRKFFRKQSADDQTVSQKWKEMVLRQKRLTRTYYDVVTIQMHLDAFSKRKLSQIFDPIFVNVFILVFSLGRVNYYLRYSEIGSRSSNQILR